MERKLGESIQELATRIRTDAVTCDFACIKIHWMKLSVHVLCAR